MGEKHAAASDAARTSLSSVRSFLMVCSRALFSFAALRSALARRVAFSRGTLAATFFLLFDSYPHQTSGPKDLNENIFY